MMESDSWNILHVEIPPAITLQHSLTTLQRKASRAAVLELRSAKEICTDAGATVEYEYSVLHQLYYKLRNQQRNSMLITGLKRTLQSLKRWSHLRITNDLERLFTLFPRVVGDEGVTRLPSAQYLMYVVSRMKAATVLLQKTGSGFRRYYAVCKQLLQKNYFTMQCTIVVAAMARIFCCFMAVESSLGSFYAALRPLLQLLSADEQIPEQLVTADMSAMHDLRPLLISPSSRIESLKAEPEETKEEGSPEAWTRLQQADGMSGLAPEEDVGEPISREDFLSKSNPAVTVDEKKKKHSLQKDTTSKKTKRKMEDMASQKAKQLKNEPEALSKKVKLKKKDLTAGKGREQMEKLSQKEAPPKHLKRKQADPEHASERPLKKVKRKQTK